MSEIIGTLTAIILFFTLPVLIIYFIVRALSKKKPVKMEVKDAKPKDRIDQSFISDGIRFSFPDHSRIDLIDDKFEKTKILKFHHTGAYGLDKYMFFTERSDSFFMGFRVVNDKILLIVSTYQKEINLSKDDAIKILFDDEEIIELKLEKAGYKHDKDDGGVIIESFSTIDEEKLKRFVEHDIDKIRMYTKDGFVHNISVDLRKAESFSEAAYSFYYSYTKFYEKGEYITHEEYLNQAESPGVLKRP